MQIWVAWCNATGIKTKSELEAIANLAMAERLESVRTVMANAAGMATRLVLEVEEARAAVVETEAASGVHWPKPEDIVLPVLADPRKARAGWEDFKKTKTVPFRTDMRRSRTW